MKWFRFYHEALDDPKVQLLPPPMFKHWVNILCLASKQKKRGILPALPDIAFALRLSEPETVQVVDNLRGRELLDLLTNGSLRIHNWTLRQPDSDDSTERVRRYRNGGEAVTVTASDLDTDTDTETETETDVRASALSQVPRPKQDDPVGPKGPGNHARTRVSRAKSPEPDQNFEHFYALYPRHEAKERAWRNWQARLKGGEQDEQILRAAENYALYCRERGVDREHILLASTFVGVDRRYRDWINGSPRASPNGRASEPKGMAGLREWMRQHDVEVEL